MNGLNADLAVIREVAAQLPASANAPEALLCLPATLIASAAGIADGSMLSIGGETCHPAAKGAHTGDISAEMIKDAGGVYVIVGHSERRADHAESNEMVAGQASAAIRAGLVPIICVGETLQQREDGQVSQIIASQLAGCVPEGVSASDFIVAYEPVWAIGTGRVAGPEQIAEVHAQIRDLLVGRFGAQGRSVRILYGGSMNPANATEILQVANVNGGLIGGASLKAADFLSIYEAAAY